MNLRSLIQLILSLFVVGMLVGCEATSQLLGNKSSIDDIFSTIPPVSSTPPVSSPVSSVWVQSDIYGGWHTDCVNFGGSDFYRLFYSFGSPNIEIAQCVYPSQLDCEQFNSGNFSTAPTVNSGFVWYPNDLASESVSQGVSITSQPGYYFGVNDLSGNFTILWGHPNSKNKMIGLNSNTGGAGSPGIFNNGVIDYTLLKSEFSTLLQMDLTTIHQSSFSVPTYVYLVRRNSASAPANCGDSGGQ